MSSWQENPFTRRLSVIFSPLPERFDVVWAAREADVLMYHDGDLLRDVLGLVHFYKGEEIVLFSYASPRRGFVHVPTVVEAMGGWAFWPAPPRQPQTTINYRTGHRGLR